MEIGDIRKEYTKNGLDLDNSDKSPFIQFEKWFQEAVNSELLEPNAMVLGTCNENNVPYQRTVLLKAFDENGFVFYTNYGSRKAAQINQNNSVSLLFPWFGLERQVSIVGKAQKVSTAESLKYFISRPHGSQLGAWVSQQSSVITSRSLLENKLSELKRKFQEGKVPLPDFWGGYRVVPELFEFWQGRPNRLHDRIQYEMVNENWNKSRLSP